MNTERKGEAFTDASENREASAGVNASPLQSISARRIHGIPSFKDRPIWHRNYYERIIRDEDELHRIRDYVTYNPFNWATDDENPAKK